MNVCYKQTVHIFTGMSYQLKVTIDKFDFKFCNEIFLSIFIIEKRDENKSTDKLILSLEVICKAKELYIFVNKLSFYSFLGQNLQYKQLVVTHINLHCSKVYRNKKRNRALDTYKNSLKRSRYYFITVLLYYIRREQILFSWSFNKIRYR